MTIAAILKHKGHDVVRVVPTQHNCRSGAVSDRASRRRSPGA